MRLTEADPPVALRQKADLADAEIGTIERKLATMGAKAKDGPWAMRIAHKTSDYDSR